MRAVSSSGVAGGARRKTQEAVETFLLIGDFQRAQMAGHAIGRSDIQYQG
jgi:hypothetical protein